MKCSKRKDIVTSQCKVVILYFSGTGNTKIISELFNKEFSQKGCLVDCISLEKIIPEKFDFDKYDLIGLGFPVHAWDAPEIFYDFINQIPPVDSKKVFLYKTAGDPFLNGGTTLKIRKILKKAGYNVFYETLFAMPANIFLRYDDRLIKQLYNAAVKMIPEEVSAILKFTKQIYSSNFIFDTLIYLVSRFESVGSKLFGKNLETLSSCTMCGKCISDCPVQNIQKSDGKITFSSNCILCMRCLKNCPVQAIVSRNMKWIVPKPWYEIEEIINDTTIPCDFLDQNCPFYFKGLLNYLNNR